MGILCLMCKYLNINIQKPIVNAQKRPLITQKSSVLFKKVQRNGLVYPHFDFAQ